MPLSSGPVLRFQSIDELLKLLQLAPYQVFGWPQIMQLKLIVITGVHVDVFTFLHIHTITSVP